MSVDSKQRRTGLGRAIVEELCTRARAAGYREVRLETSTAWTDAVDFYRACGFRVTHTEDREGDPSTHMSRVL